MQHKPFRGKERGKNMGKIHGQCTFALHCADSEAKERWCARIQTRLQNALLPRTYASSTGERCSLSGASEYERGLDRRQALVSKP
jgi:hypothetical protein